MRALRITFRTSHIFVSEFRAAAPVGDITPMKWPVYLVGSFSERPAEKAWDPLSARALVMDDGENVSTAMQIALLAVLTSPNFLFRWELDPTAGAATFTLHVAGSIDLARLSIPAGVLLLGHDDLIERYRAARHTKDELQNAAALNIRRRADHKDLVDGVFAAGLEQEWYVEHDHIRAITGRVLKKQLPGLADERMDDRL